MRGSFLPSDGKLINADLNAAYNIIRRVFPNAFPDWITSAELHPIGLMKELINSR